MKHYQNYDRMQPSIKNITEQFNQLDRDNKQLINLSHIINNSSFINHNHNTLNHLQSELRTNLRCLVDSIRDFFVDIDQRLRSLGLIIQEKQRNSQHIQQIKPMEIINISPRKEFHDERSNFQNCGKFQESIVQRVSGFNNIKNNVQQDPYNHLVQRIACLQSKFNTSLSRQTEHKKGLRQEDQTTIIDGFSKKDTGFRSQRLHESNNKAKTNSHIQTFPLENSFRLFSLKQTIEPQKQETINTTNSPYFFCNSRQDIPTQQFLQPYKLNQSRQQWTKQDQRKSCKYKK